MEFNWKLNDSQFSSSDRLKISKFFIDPKNFWSQGIRVAQFEDRMARFMGSKYSVFCSSGSSANTLLAMNLKDNLTDNRRIVVFPTIGWQTTYSPFIREGFTPHFIDISLKDFSMDLDALDAWLKKNSHKVALVFIVSLLGFTPDIDRIKQIQTKYNVKIQLDNCENTFGHTVSNGARKFICSEFTSTTSYYMGHTIQACGEGGMVFTNDRKEYEYLLMARNHGMTRSVDHLFKDPSLNPYRNKDVDPRFDFYIMGNNFRGTDVSAFVADLDMDRAEKYIKMRMDLYNTFKSLLSPNFYLPVSNRNETIRDVPFCLPLIAQNKKLKDNAVKLCNRMGIETRPVVSSNIGRHTCYKKIVNYSSYPQSELVHNFGFYVGLHAKVKKESIIDLVENLNQLC